MGGFFSPPKAPAPPPPPAPPKKSDADVQARGLEERRRMAAQRGRASTILTGSQGVSGETVAKKTLLGE